ncbi:slr0269 [Synechocystis sp. PCC 6803]|uniref:Uncharacterized protein slr0269 n=1 Tax=Synechocystis sp. (strain ATCC 27184 / PCC 6803 / Kazusa) TaxID=1111708 RepID=Y269_SYNY3|nr:MULTISPECIES: hypothetical protein [unclassified Synechocystis]P73888.1 RecName: Full=Uncharacterized protein slr0269 [Synechocystis sp. PCC 6803 substr. Kazusa]BAM51707.1 hypothetical protein BEST7613_2776 [Synechocystis sp. PCC 6803] [Bacillus subtilis BEST7613]AGF51640.1 hypothetical protein MYO_113880 [Synechocystis sp. PCC 6803]ALJ67632.1 hypothetical protein AOY38_07110 [Synechocystis sp. PCC 6803]AVP89472.1 hypothetical protein C7I86_07130 [Synechocystis sp. IPPAS B-1465]MBD2619756.
MPSTFSQPSPSNALVNDRRDVFPLSPLIKITLVNLYLALTVPLPILAQLTQGNALLTLLLTVGLMGGLVALVAALAEQVVLNGEGIAVRYPRWVPKFFRSGWQLSWADVTALKCRTTGQGGLVYYFLTESKDRAYLLPMRVAGFNRLTQLVSDHTGIDTQDVRPLSQPWMYLLLLLFTFLLWGSQLAIVLLLWSSPPLA